jgi:hypothetical protein
MIYRASRLLLIITLIAIGYEYPSATGKQVMDEPRPTKAVEGIIKLFDRFPIVALGEMLGAVFVILPHHGFDERNDELERRLSSWPEPELSYVKNTWLGGLDPDLFYPVSKMLFSIKPDGTRVPAPRPYGQLKFQDIADAYLYLVPRGSLVWDTLPPEVERDEEYKRELDRRNKILWNQD